MIAASTLDSSRRRPIRRSLVAGMCALGIAGASSRSMAQVPEKLREIDAAMERQLDEWGVPGVALAVVKDDVVALAKGYGHRRLGHPAPVTAQTVFGIGSCTKAFTAAALGLLVDRGQLRWDDRVARHLPSFQLDDPLLTDAITVRDLLAHRSGLAPCGTLYFGRSIERNEVIRRLRWQRPTAALRAEFQYTNVAYVAAGQIVPALTRTSWDDFVASRIFAPLGMISTSTTVDALGSDQDVASPHEKLLDDDGALRVEAVDWRNVDNAGPAMSINSTASDMARWIRFLLAEGAFGETRLLAPAALGETMRPQCLVDPRSLGLPSSATPAVAAYGFGWFIRDYRSRRLLEHGGRTDGMTAHVALVPEERLGVVILANLAGTHLPEAVASAIVDAYLDAPKRDWDAGFRKLSEEADERRVDAWKTARASRVAGTKPSRAPADYAGQYGTELYGDAQVSVSDDRLMLEFDAMSGPLEHWQDETFLVRFRDRRMGRALLTFILDDQGQVDAIDIRDFETPPLVLTRSTGGRHRVDPPFPMTQEKLLRYTGRYRGPSPSFEARVDLYGERLRLALSGDSTYWLVPTGPDRFQEDRLTPSFSLEFAMEEKRPSSFTLDWGPLLKVTFDRVP